MPRLRGICRAPWTRKPLRAVTSADIQRWLDQRRETVSVATANRDRSMISAIFEWAIKRGYAMDNPARRVPRESEEGRAREMWLTADECQALLAGATGALRSLMLLGLHTGFRKDELFTLEWRSVDFEAARVAVEPEREKNGKGRYVPMTDEVRKLLQEFKNKRPSVRPTDRVLLTSRGRPLNTKALDRRWRTLKKGEVEVIEADRLKKTTAHTLRHTYASHLAQAGVSLTTIAQLLGHSSAYVTERYAHLSPDPDDTIGPLLSQRLVGSPDVVRDRAAEVLPALESLNSESIPVAMPSTDLRRTA